MTKEITQVAFYTRISTDEDHQKYSLGAQEERLAAFCTSQFGRDWRKFKLYKDMESGTHMNRPGLEEMLFDAEQGAFKMLLVFRVDRLSRKVRELSQMVEELTKHGVALKSITEPFDTTSAAGKMMLQMLGVFAEFEHATIVERTKVGMEKKAKGGAFVGGHIPFGYDHEPGKGLIVNEEEAVLVRKMFKMYTFGRQGSQAIIKELNNAGHRKRSGRKWEKQAVLHILRSPLYIGKLRWSEMVYDGNHDAIVSEEIFGKASTILEKRQKELGGQNWHNGDQRLLSGIIKCGKCKTNMVGVSTTRRGKKFPYYICNKRWRTHDCDQDYVRGDLLEAGIIQDVKTILKDEQLLARIWVEANKRLVAEKPDLDNEIEKVEDKMARARRTEDRYFKAFEAETMKPELCTAKIEDLKAQQDELETERTDLQARRERLNLPELDKAMLAKMVDNLEEVMEAGTNAQKKHLLQRIVKKVLIHDRHTVEVWYGLPNPPSVRRPLGLAPRMCQCKNQKEGENEEIQPGTQPSGLLSGAHALGRREIFPNSGTDGHQDQNRYHGAPGNPPLGENPTQEAPLSHHRALWPGWQQ